VVATRDNALELFPEVRKRDVSLHLIVAAKVLLPSPREVWKGSQPTRVCKQGNRKRHRAELQKVLNGMPVCDARFKKHRITFTADEQLDGLSRIWGFTVPSMTSACESDWRTTARTSACRPTSTGVSFRVIM
jgi:hypothetical protein